MTRYEIKDKTDIIRAGGLMVGDKEKSQRPTFLTIEESVEVLKSKFIEKKENEKQLSPEHSQALEQLGSISKKYRSIREKAQNPEKAKEAAQEKIDFNHELLKEWTKAEIDNDKTKGWMGVVMSRTPHAWTGAKKSDVYSSAQKKEIKKAFDGKMPTDSDGMPYDKLSLTPHLSKNSDLKNKTAEQMVSEGVYDAQLRVARKFARANLVKETTIDPIMQNLKKINQEGNLEQGQDVFLFAPVGVERSVEDGKYTHSSRNVLATAQAYLLQRKLSKAISEDEELNGYNLQVSVAKNFIQKTEFNSTDAGPLEKLASVHQFDVLDPKEGKDGKRELLFDGDSKNITDEGQEYKKRIQNSVGIVVDDDSELGGTIKSLSMFAKKNTKAFAGASVVMESPGVANMQVSNEQASDFQKLVGAEDYKKYNKLFKERGLEQGVEGLTPLQLTVLYATVMNYESKENGETKATFEKMKEKLSLDDNTLKNYKKTLSKQHYVDKIESEARSSQVKLRDIIGSKLQDPKNEKVITFDAFEHLFNNVRPEQQSYEKLNPLPFNTAIQRALLEKTAFSGRVVFN